MHVRDCRLFVLLTAVFLGSFLPGMAWGDFYSFTDRNGVVHFTNVPTTAKFRWLMPERGSTGRPEYVSFDELIRDAAYRYGVDPELVKAVIKVESDFNPYVVSKDGAMGLMQLMPETARTMGVRDPYDPAENIMGGVKFLSHLLKRFNGRTHLAIAAYNAGETAVLKYRSIPPFQETRLFVKKVLDYHRIYKNTVRSR